MRAALSVMTGAKVPRGPRRPPAAYSARIASARSWNRSRRRLRGELRLRALIVGWNGLDPRGRAACLRFADGAPPRVPLAPRTAAGLCPVGTGEAAQGSIGRAWVAWRSRRRAQRVIASRRRCGGPVDAYGARSRRARLLPWCQRQRHRRCERWRRPCRHAHAGPRASRPLSHAGASSRHGVRARSRLLTHACLLPHAPFPARTSARRARPRGGSPSGPRRPAPPHARARARRGTTKLTIKTHAGRAGPATFKSPLSFFLFRCFSGNRFSFSGAHAAVAFACTLMYA